MRYILIIDKNNYYTGTIFKFYKYDESIGYNPNAIAVKILSNTLSTKKGNILYFQNVKNYFKWKDATPVYDKISKLYKYIGIHSPREMRIKTDAALRMLHTTKEIKKNFENGKYPTKPEFYYMNKIWKKIK